MGIWPKEGRYSFLCVFFSAQCLEEDSTACHISDAGFVSFQLKYKEYFGRGQQSTPSLDDIAKVSGEYSGRNKNQ